MPVRVVLVEPSHPGNIGAVARAMGNMGCAHLSLVRPTDHLVEEARVRAANNDEILFNAQLHSSLKEALGPCTYVVGTSARSRTIDWPSMSLRLAMEKLTSIERQGETVAILFGSERTGLTNRQLDYCDVLVRIPTSSKAPSINLAGSVLLILYELRMAMGFEVPKLSKKVKLDSEIQLANRFQTEGLFRQLNEIMVEVEFISEPPRDKLMRKIRRIFLRPGLTVEDVNILRGILTNISRKIDEK